MYNIQWILKKSIFHEFRKEHDILIQNETFWKKNYGFEEFFFEIDFFFWIQRIASWFIYQNIRTWTNFDVSEKLCLELKLILCLHTGCLEKWKCVLYACGITFWLRFYIYVKLCHCSSLAIRYSMLEHEYMYFMYMSASKFHIEYCCSSIHIIYGHTH